MKEVTVLIDTLIHDGELRDLDEVLVLEDAQADALISIGAVAEVVQDREEGQVKKTARKK